MIDLLVHSLIDTWQIVPRVLIIMFISLYVSQILIEIGFIKRLEFIGRPLVRLANLPHQAGITFLASFGSVLAGNTMLARLYQEKKINSRQTLLAALLNTTPVYLKETFTYHIPIIIPLLGIKVGLVYFMTFIVSGMIRTLFVIIYGRITLKRDELQGDSVDPNFSDTAVTTKRKFNEVLVLAFTRQKKLFLKVSSIFVFTTFLIFMLINNGLVAGLVDYVAPLTNFFKLPPSCAVPVGTYMFSPLVGATSLGAMIKEGILTDLQGITACLLGSLLMLPIFTLKYSLPKYTSIFGVYLGLNILLVSTSLGMFSRAVFLLFFLCIS
ncbi:MAG: hypothetical protein HF982_03410 [Desulfobacteraceae bacterium]|nr:hypothetical protein [Desulfobacteraceae bacterium]MBC2718633.1 hypothetical protein [Desulfobacteraceae bacterium]